MEQKDHHIAAAAISQIKDLPNEILAHIFLIGTEQYSHETYFPIIVSEVCSHWRHLAHITPFLWQTIIPPLHKLSTGADSVCWTEKWLTRSQTLPISVVIDDRSCIPQVPGTDQRSRDVISGVFLATARHVARVYRLDIWSEHLSLDDLRQMILPDLPNINFKQISLCFPYIANTHVHTGLHDIRLDWLSEVVSLKKVRYRGVRPPLVPSLTSLAIHSFQASYSNIETLFNSSPNIRSLVLHKLHPLITAISPFTREICVASLEAVAVSLAPLLPSETVTGGVYMFSLLTMPNLTYLEVDGEVPISSVFRSSLSSSNIKTLRLSRRPSASAWSTQSVVMADLKLLHSFTGLRNIELIQCAPEGLLSNTADAQRTLTRKASINFRPSSTNNHGLGEISHIAQQGLHWSNATCIKVDTLSAEDIMHLCRFVQLRKNIRAVYLPKAARRHLSQSLLRNGNIIFQKPTFLNRKTLYGEDSDGGTSDVYDWLNRLVDIRLLGTPSFGMLDGEKYPLQELR